ncbi:WD40-like beta propeller repeat domain-containing protein [Ditylenchus destructor]|uniref:WD40-like beta propeller repeat domain-containing protein n=1 Tax=Ditylenchus destructor TaxID=166010 RepID=A0AAD4R4H3_9BILA|nr:WD40-like beta propeller repeat domain-containing protein [Ditylenchus destructor]
MLLIPFSYFNSFFFIILFFDYLKNIDAIDQPSSADFISLTNTRQLTFGPGIDSRPLFSHDGRYIAFQGYGRQKYGTKTRQIYRLDQCHMERRASRLSTGLGSCSGFAFYPDGDMVYSGSFHHPNVSNVLGTHHENMCGSKNVDRDSKLKQLCKTSNFLYELSPHFDLFKTNALGNFKAQLTKDDGIYNGEPDISPDGRWAVFTSTRSGHPELWIMNATDGSDKKQLTNKSTVFGYKGGATFSPDGSKIVFHVTRPKSKHTFLDLLKYNLVDRALPTEIYTINVDGNGLKQVTQLGGISWAARFVPLRNGRILFTSNYNSSNNSMDVYQRGFNLFSIEEDGSDITQLTFNTDGIDAFPVVDRAARWLLWGSSRNGSSWKTLNLFLADVSNTTKSMLNCPNDEDREIPNSSKDFIRSLQQINAGKVQNRGYKAVHFKGEKHLENIQQLTFGGQNAEGYFSFTDESIVLQATGMDRYGTQCDQIYRADFVTTMPQKDTLLQRLSTGLGACTCSYFFPDGKHSIHATTFADNLLNLTDVTKTCPPKKCSSEAAKTDPVLKKLCNTSYTWDLFPAYDIYKVNEYGNIIARLTNTPGYDAEGAVSPDGSQIVFTSMRTGDPELWLMDADGSNQRQLTNGTLGYDGGPFFSPDGTKVIFRASRPKTQKDIQKYKQLLSYNLVEPLAMELYVINVDGSGQRPITQLGGSNWAPYYLKDNRRIIFSSNFNATGHFGAFDLYVIGEDGRGLERITYNENGFDAFPMMSYNGRKLIWGSSRNGKSFMELNLFLADWKN